MFRAKKFQGRFFMYTVGFLRAKIAISVEIIQGKRRKSFITFKTATEGKPVYICYITPGID
jgi:hypothetical protein